MLDPWVIKKIREEEEKRRRREKRPVLEIPVCPPEEIPPEDGEEGPCHPPRGVEILKIYGNPEKGAK